MTDRSEESRERHSPEWSREHRQSGDWRSRDGGILLPLAVARLPHLIEERLRAGIDGKIAQIDRLLALQVHNDQLSAVVVKRKLQRRIAVRRVHWNKMPVLAMKSAAECVAGKPVGSLVQRHVSLRMIEQRVAAPIEGSGSAGIQMERKRCHHLGRRRRFYFVRQFQIRRGHDRRRWRDRTGGETGAARSQFPKGPRECRWRRSDPRRHREPPSGSSECPRRASSPHVRECRWTASSGTRRQKLFSSVPSR